VTGKVDRGSVDVGAVPGRTAAGDGDLESMTSRRSDEIFASLRLNKQRSCEQAERERKSIVEAWKEQGRKELDATLNIAAYSANFNFKFHLSLEGASVYSAAYSVTRFATTEPSLVHSLLALSVTSSFFRSSFKTIILSDRSFPA